MQKKITQSSGPLVAGVIGRGTVLEEQPNDGRVALPGGRVQGRPVLVVPGVDARAALGQQERHHLHVALPGAHVQSRSALWHIQNN